MAESVQNQNPTGEFTTAHAEEQTIEIWTALINQAQSGEEVEIFSPYVGPMLERLVLVGSKRRVSFSIYTIISVKVFAEGSSDLKVVNRLFKKANVKFFHLESLHAKILLHKETIIFGSQNFHKTKNLNKELNCKVDSTSLIQQVKKIISQWKVHSSPVSSRQIEKIFELVSRIKPEIDKLETKMNRAEKLIEGIRRKEDFERRRQANEARLAEKREVAKSIFEKLRTEFQENTEWENNQTIILEKKQGQNYRYGLSRENNSLDVSLLSWGTVELIPLKRYFTLIENGETPIPLVGFSRLNRTIITRVSTAVSETIRVDCFLKNHGQWKFNFSRREPTFEDPWNFNAELSSGSSMLRFRGAFLGHSVEIQRDRLFSSNDEKSRDLRRDIEKEMDVFSRFIQRIRLPSFEYKSGSKLNDTYDFHKLLSQTFCRKWQLKLGTLKDDPTVHFLVIKALT